MPTYEYRCEACGHEFEEFQSITAAPLRTCPHCKKRKLQRLIGTGGGILFKGSGFYETDYRSESYRKAADAEKKSADPKSDSKKDDNAKKDTPTKKKADTGGDKPNKSGGTSKTAVA